MKVVLTNLSNKLYENSRFRLNSSARKFSIDEINSYDFEDIKTSSFYQQHKNILDHPKGMGYWAWKPYIILETMKSISDGDIVAYSDSGIEIIEKLDPLIDLCANKEPILLLETAIFPTLSGQQDVALYLWVVTMKLIGMLNISTHLFACSGKRNKLSYF